jgi:hypothetical protein
MGSLLGPGGRRILRGRHVSSRHEADTANVAPFLQGEGQGTRYSGVALIPERRWLVVSRSQDTRG